MKLYFHPMSGNSRRTLARGRPPRHSARTHRGRPDQGRATRPPHLRRNPNGRVPVLDDDGFVLWESRAIMQYLADRTPGQTLLPSEPRGRAEVSRWLFWCAATWRPRTRPGLRALREVGHGPRAGGSRRGRARTGARHAERGDAGHAPRGQDVGLAGSPDARGLSLAAWFALAGPAHLPIGDYANLRAWLGRVKELDAWKSTAPPARG